MIILEECEKTGIAKEQEVGNSAASSMKGHVPRLWQTMERDAARTVEVVTSESGSKSYSVKSTPKKTLKRKATDESSQSGTQVDWLDALQGASAGPVEEKDTEPAAKKRKGKHAAAKTKAKAKAIARHADGDGEQLAPTPKKKAKASDAKAAGNTQTTKKRICSSKGLPCIQIDTASRDELCVAGGGQVRAAHRQSGK